MNNIDDNELISLINEESEVVKDIIYEKYNSLVDIILKKYYNLIKMLQIDEEEIRCEAMYGFSDGINCFDPKKDASLKTFLSLCIERRVTKYLSKFTTSKHKLLYDSLSLDYKYDNETSLIDSISDDKKSDPLNNLTEIETFEEVINMARDVLSMGEYEVFKYMLEGDNYQVIAKKLDKTPKQIDNTIQRIKSKLKDILKNNI